MCTVEVESVERDVPGRDGDLAALIAAYEAIARGAGGGRTVFLSGDAGSGRTELLRMLAAAARRADPPATVLAGGFHDGRFVGWDEDGPPAAKVMRVVENVVLLASAMLPYAALLGQVLSKSKAAGALVRDLFDKHERLAPTELLPRLLGALCAEGPAVCLVDDADRAPDGLWADLVLGMGGRVASDWPLLLVLALDGPARLGDHDDGEPDSLYVARCLRGDGVADWHPLAAVELGELERWTGATAPDVLRALLDVTGGRAAWVAQLWRHWRASGVVVQDDDRVPCWRFARDGRARAADPVEDVLGRRRMVELVGDDTRALREARELLVCAALEGRRFTAEGVAAALRRDRDEVIDLLDERLARDADHPLGLVVEDGSVEVDDETGRRTLWRYRFAAELDWLTLSRHHGLTDARRSERAGELARALRELYGGQAHRIAHALARLFMLAGDLDTARHFARMADNGVSREVILWRARAVLDAPDPHDHAGRRRASQLLTAAAGELFHSGPFTDGLRFADAAHRLASLRGDQAEALQLTGHHQAMLGEYEQARTTLRRARPLFREIGDRHGEAVTRHELARIDVEQGNYDEARAEFTWVLALCRELGDLRGEAVTRHELVQIDVAQGNYDEARAELTRVLARRRDLGDRHSEAVTRHALAWIDVARGRYDEARAELIPVLALFRELGDLHGEAVTRHDLARIDVAQGNYDEARAELTRVLARRRELGDRNGEAITRHMLARIDVEQGNHERARAELVRVLTLRRELGDRRGEAITRHMLARIDVEQGNHDQARAELTRVLALHRELGDRASEAIALKDLAALDADDA